MEGQACTEELAYQDSCKIYSGGAVRLSHGGTVCTNTIAGWVKLAQGQLPDNVHIEAMQRAIHWHFGPSDASKVMRKYLELVNEHSPAEQR